MGSAREVIGRDPELRELSDRLAAHRLVTLIGPGGMGKTALAQVAAAQAADRFALGGHFIDLTRVEDAAGVEASLAVQLGFPSFAALLDSPSDQSALLVVDNCEHVLDAVASAIERLLSACEAPTILATSRSPLGLPFESVVVLGPLEVPAANSTDVRAAAAQLFLARVRDAGVTTEPADRAAVVALCRALDGVPLALEIAAARTRVLTPAEILGHLDHLDVLSRPRFRGDERHRSLRSTIEWSYRRLAPEDQQFFDRLAVLAGSFDLADARAVGLDRGSEVDALDKIDVLVAASLLGTETVPEGTRYRQLDTVRTFARDRLVASGRWDATWDRFVDHVVEWPRALLDRASGRWDGAIVGSMLARFDSHMNALRWTAVHDETPERSLTLLATLWGVVHQGHAEEIGELAESTLSRWPDPGHRGWADAAATAATCRYLLGAPEEAILLAEQALEFADPRSFAPATLRRVIAQSLTALGDVSAAVIALDEAIDVARGPLPSLAWEMETLRAELAANLGEVEAGLRAVRRVQDEAMASGSEINAIWAASVEGSLLLRVDPDAALEAADAALDRSRAVRYPACESVNLHTLAEAAIARGRLDHAADLLAELVDLLVGGGARTELRNALRAAAVVLHRAGDPAWADLAATADDLPSCSVFVIPGHERMSLPVARGRVLDPREAVARCRAGLERVGGPSGAPVEGAVDPAVPLRGESHLHRAGRFVTTGELWELTWADRTVLLQASKGMDDIARLLGRRGNEVHSMELMDGGVEEDSTGDVIDARARREYEQRVRGLQEEVESAERDHDTARAELARAELDAVVDHLTAALSRSGRSRRGSSSAERARSAVTQRIRSTIRRITTSHPELGRHLEVSIRTGTYCSYQPEDAVDWDLGERPRVTT